MQRWQKSKLEEPRSLMTFGGVISPKIASPWTYFMETPIILFGSL